MHRIFFLGVIIDIIGIDSLQGFMLYDYTFGNKNSDYSSSFE